MSLLDVNRGGAGRGWNYNDPNKDGYSTTLTGDVVKIEVVQKLSYGTRQPEFWPDGNPKGVIRFTLAAPDGREIAWTFGPGGAGDKASTAFKACVAACGDGCKSIAELGGKNVTISTVQPPQGFSYGQGNPRPWTVQVNGPASQPFQGVVDHLAQPAAPAQNGQVPAAQEPVNRATAIAIEAAKAAGATVTEVTNDPYAGEDIPF